MGASGLATLAWLFGTSIKHSQFAWREDSERHSPFNVVLTSHCLILSR